jgi:hypothetical protein
VAVIDEARDADADLVLVVWGERCGIHRAGEHLELLASALATPGPTTVDVPVALEDTALLVDAAGEVIAWGGLTASQ